MLWSDSSTRRRVRELEEQVAKLEALVKSRDLDWDEMRARCKRLLDRTEKQYRALADAEAQSELPVDDTSVPSTVTLNGSNVPLISPAGERLERLKKQIAERRR